MVSAPPARNSPTATAGVGQGHLSGSPGGPGTDSGSAQWILIAAIFIVGFAIDLLTPRGITDWMIYEMGVIAALRARPKRVPLIAAAAGNVMAILGFWFSGPAADPWAPMVSLGAGMGVMWATALFGLRSRRKNEEIRSSEKKFRLLCERNLAGVFHSTLDGHFLDCNDAFARILGFESREELLKHPELNFYWHAADRRLFLDRLLQEKFLSNLELCFNRKDGAPIKVLENATLVEPGENQPPHIEGILLDVTERERAANGLRLFRTLVDHSADALLVVDPDTGHVLDANERLCRSLGYAREELPALSISDIDPTLTEVARTGVREKLMSTGILMKSVHRRKDGSNFPVEVNIRLVELDRSYLIASVRDITARIQAERAFWKSEERYRALVLATSQMIWTANAYGEVAGDLPTWRAYTGQTEEEIQKAGWANALHPEDREPTMTKWSAAVQRHSPFDTEYRVRRADGQYRHFAVRGVPVDDEDGEIREWVGACTDITERKRLEEQYQQAQKMEAVGCLAGGVAHDFNNLLTVINGYGDLLLGELNPGDPIRDKLAEIRKAGDRAADLTQQLLAFSRRQIVQPKVLDLNQAVHYVENMLRRVLGEDVELATLLDPGLGKIRCDAGQLTQVLMNLAVNARDAMPKGGHLFIQTANINFDESCGSEYHQIKPGPYVQLSISDSGIGMDEATKARIFEPFFTTKQPGEGTGLGLATVYGIVTQAGGSISVYSEVGHGTIFKIVFPRVDEVLHAEETQADTAAMSLRGKETILLAEDQAELRKLAEVILQSYGYKVLEAANGPEALLKSHNYTEPIHLLLTDVILPGMSGRELAEQLTPLRPHMKVLYMSGYAANIIAQRGILDEGVEYLSKPFAPGDLAQKVRRVLGPLHPVATILVVDDEPAIRTLLRQVLEGAGYNVLEAEDGEKAIALATAETDLVITDLVMPDREGLETIRLLRKQKPDLKIIAMSGAFHGEFLEVAEKLGAVATLAKPIRPNDLLKTVREVTAGVLPARH